MVNICVTLLHADCGIRLLSLPIHKLRPGSIAIFVVASSIRNALYRKCLSLIAYNDLSSLAGRELDSLISGKPPDPACDVPLKKWTIVCNILPELLLSFLPDLFRLSGGYSGCIFTKSLGHALSKHIDRNLTLDALHMAIQDRQTKLTFTIRGAAYSMFLPSIYFNYTTSL